jgi:hypothetical protein
MVALHPCGDSSSAEARARSATGSRPTRTCRSETR